MNYLTLKIKAPLSFETSGPIYTTTALNLGRFESPETEKVWDCFWRSEFEEILGCKNTEKSDKKTKSKRQICSSISACLLGEPDALQVVVGKRCSAQTSYLFRICPPPPPQTNNLAFYLQCWNVYSSTFIERPKLSPSNASLPFHVIFSLTRLFDRKFHCWKTHTVLTSSDPAWPSEMYGIAIAETNGIMLCGEMITV
jgi:hypothetical protein